MKNIQKLIASIAASLVVAGTLIVDGSLNAADYIAIAASFFGSLAVYLVPNKE